jgi:hypothetical protein
MGVERRRTGFRLPWVGEGADSDGEQAEADVEVDEMTPSNGATVPASENTTPSTIAETGEPKAGSEPITATVAAPETDSADFLANLVGAMRGVAETSRDASLNELRAAVEERVQKLGDDGTEQEAELRRRADVDIEAVGDWERSEIERVRSAADAKRDTRRRELEQQLDEHRTATERQIEATRSRMAEHERDLAAFFAQLG